MLERSEASQGGEGHLCYNNLQMKEYYVYILANKSGMLYTGMTNDLERRLYEHKNKLIEGFTKKYNINKLLYFESTDDVSAAIAREKTIKGMLRSKKIELIKTHNPLMNDLSEQWFNK
jgi:putative endonuclease